MQKAAGLYAQIEARRAELGLSQAEVGQRAFGKPDSTALQNIRRGASPSFERVGALADALGWELYFGPKRESGSAETVEPGKDAFALVPLIEAELAAGQGALNTADAVIAQMAFRQDWLYRQGVAPSAARLARVRGDSMAPTLQPGDLVLVDTAAREPAVRPRLSNRRRPAPIFALRHEDGAVIKRLERPAPDQLMLVSDNPAYAPELWSGPELEEVDIIGRVVWWGHTVRE